MKSFKKTAILLAVILTLAMCFTFGASAEGELTDGAFSYTVANDKATIVKVDPSAEDGLFVPAELGGYPVEGIALDAFEGCDGILTVHYCGTQQDWDIICAGNDVLSGKALHLAVTVPETPAKCEETGLTEGVQCEACDKWFTEQSEIPALGHSFTDYQPDGNATIFADGTKTAYCDNGCGEWETLPDEGSKLVFGKPESVTSVTTTSSITLNWTEVKGATGYRIFYMTANGWKKCATLTDTTRTFSNLKAGAKFTFAVRAYNIDGDVLTWAPSYTTHETAVQPEMPAKITSTQNEDGIRLTWTAVKGATGYRVYIKTAEGWKKRADTVKTTQTMLYFEEATKYTFAVRPFIKTADTVIWGPYRTYQGATSPSYTNVEDFKNESGTIIIGCNGGKGADVWELYYKKPKDSKYKLYARTKEYKSYTFKNLAGGTEFDFVMRAGVYKEDGIAWSHYSSRRVKVNYRIDRYVDFTGRSQFGFITHDGNGTYTTFAVKSDKYCIEARSNGQVQRLLFADPYCYVIDDTNKLYYAEKDAYAAREAYYSTRDLFLWGVSFKTTKETSGGKTYIVESYTNNGATIKYYFDGATLVKEAGIMEGKEVYTTYYTKFSKTVSNSYFAVPSNYTRVTA